MSVPEYSKDVNYCAFMQNVSELKIPDDLAVKRLVEGYAGSDYRLILLANDLRGVELFDMSMHSFKETYQYYKTLLPVLCKTLGRSYSGDMIDILIAATAPIPESSEQGLDEALGLLESVLDTDLVLGGELWYLRESVRYRLLDVYASRKLENSLDRIRDLLPVAKANKELYTSIQTSVDRSV